MPETKVISLQEITFDPRALDPELFTEAAINEMKGTTIWKGPFQGDGLTGPELQDPCALSMKELCREQILFSTGLQGAENAISGDVRWGRFQYLRNGGLVLAGAKQFLGLWSDYKRYGPHSMLGWIAAHDHILSFDFLGTLLRGANGKPYILQLFQRDPRTGWFASWHEASETVKLHSLVFSRET